MARGPAWVWVAAALAWVIGAMSLPAGTGLSWLAQFAVAALACTAFNLLLGQAGLLSFGHALYAGLGTWAAVHLLRAMSGGWIWSGAVGVVLVPLLAGLASALVAALLGAANARRGGTAFAMISLGLAEAVWFLAQSTPGLFGGEGGLSANRVQGAPLWGLSLGPEHEVVVLMGLYMLAGLALMRRFADARAGLLLRALRDDPQRLEFLGVSATSLRWLALVVSAFFMGVSGGLAALWSEVFTTESLHVSRSGLLLVFTVLGGASVLLGPLLGAALMAATLVWLPGVSQGWMWMLGLLFVVVVWAQPRGLAGVLADGWATVRQKPADDWGPALVARLAAAGVALAGGLGLLEMGYHLPLADTLGPELQWLGLTLQVNQADAWVGCTWLLLSGAGLYWAMRGRCITGGGEPAP